MTDIPNTPEPKPVSMRDLRESLAMIARPAGVPVSFGGLSVALDELERLRALDAPALSEALKVAAEDLAREREGAGLLRMALQDLGAGDRHAARAALYSDAGKAALEERRALEAKVGKAKEAAFSEVESEMESLGFSAEEGWADVLRTLKAEVERLTRERDEAKERAVAFERLSQEFERDVRTTFEQSCKNLERARAAEAEVKRLRAALLNYLQAGHKEARERAAQQAKVALGIPPEHSGREPQYALAPSQPAPANPNIDPDTGRDHMPEPIRRPAPASPVVGEGMKVCGNCKKPIAGDEHARLEQDDSRIASVCWQSFHLGKCLEPSAPSPAGGEEGPAPAEAVDVDHRADFEERVKRHQVRCSHVEHGQRLCVGCAARAATEWLNRLLLPVNEGGSGALVSRADLDADVAKAVAEAWERAAQIVEGPMVPGSRVPTTEERGLAAIFRNRARSTSPAGGAL